MLSQKERAESEPFDMLQRYLCMQRYLSLPEITSLHAEIAISGRDNISACRDSSFCAKSVRYNIFTNGAP